MPAAIPAVPALRLAALAASLLLGGCIAPVPLGLAPASADPQRVNTLAVQHARAGRHAQAIVLWQQLTAPPDAARPQLAYLFSNLGHAYYLDGRDREALAALEQACLLDPLDALAWQHLSQVLARLGQHERAALMLAQARSLQSHDLRRDAALVRQAAVPAPAPLATPAQAAGMERIEIEQGDGVARLRRVAGRQRVAMAPSLPRHVPQALPRLEVLNGNGAPGMAATLARSLAAGPVQLARFGNAATFRVARTRIEYRAGHVQSARRLARQIGPRVAVMEAKGQGADLRLIVGHDMAQAATLHRFYLQQLQLARQALARLG